MAVSHGNPISLVKSILDFQKILPTLEIKVGVIEGEVIPGNQMKSVASMPSREVLLAQILGGIQMPGGQVAGTMVSAIRQLISTLKARADQLEGSAGSAS
jgi:large subunit ribosomal protein L10